MANDILKVNQITVEDTEHYTVLELLHKLISKINELVYSNGDIYDKLNYLLNEGLSEEVVKALTEWLNDGTLSDIITEEVLTEIDSRLDALENRPYHDYTRTEKVGYDDSCIMHDGFNNFSKKTYGRYEQGTVMSVIANVDDPVPELTGTDTKGLGTYTNRDSCSLYVANSGRTPTYIISSENVTYTGNSAIINSSIDISDIKVGMILDAGAIVNDNWYVGIIKEIQDHTLILEDGWYKVRNDGHESTKGIPDNVELKVNVNNKLWCVNSNLFVDKQCPAGTNMELGIICDHSEINDVGGIDLVNLGSYPVHYGIKVRGSIAHFNDGYISDDNGRHYVSWNSDDYLDSSLLSSYKKSDNSKLFEIKNNGELSKIKVATQVMTQSGTIGSNISMVFVTGDNVDVRLPEPDSGKIIRILTMKTDTLLTATIGIVTTTLNQQQISIGKNEGKSFRSVELISDGNVWYLINDLQ